MNTYQYKSDSYFNYLLIFFIQQVASAMLMKLDLLHFFMVD